jgi:hypothetical protein
MFVTIPLQMRIPRDGWLIMRAAGLQRDEPGNGCRNRAGIRPVGSSARC